MNLPRAGLTIIDYDGEISKVGYGIPPATAGNIATILNDANQMRLAIQGMILGRVQSMYGQMYNQKLTQARPTNVNAQRERKWLVRYYDSTEFLDITAAVLNPNYLEIDSIEIPTANLALLSAGSDRADPTHPDVIAFVEEFEDSARTKFGTRLKVIEIIAVGRNL